MADEKVKAGSLVTVKAKNEDKIFITHVEDDGTLQSKNALVSDIRNLAASLEDSEDKAINVKIANEIVKKITGLTDEVNTSFETVNQNFTNVNEAISENSKSIETANENMNTHEEDADLHVTKEKQDKWNGYEEGINNLTESVAENSASLNAFANSITNNYSTTEAGFILDARVAKAIMDYINSTCKLFAWKDMPEGTDLNTLTTSGKYRVLNPTNSPIAGDCMVYVECAWDGYIRQRVEGIWYSQDVATRIMNNGNWQAWFNLADILTKCGLI